MWRGLADGACMQVAAKVILGFDDSWLEESKLRTVQQAFVTYNTALFNFLPKFMVNVPGNSEPSPCSSCAQHGNVSSTVSTPRCPKVPSPG